MSALEFFLEGLKNIRTVGTISRSSGFVSREMTSHVDFSNSKVIIELGAGDGPITQYIVRRLKGDTKVLAFEINERLCQGLKDNILDPRLVVVQDSAEKMEHYLQANGFKQADYIISALPFVSLPEDLGERILQEAYRVLKPGGCFIQINYTLLARKRYEAIFGNSNVHFVPINIPPAFITVCTKK